MKTSLQRTRWSISGVLLLLAFYTGVAFADDVQDGIAAYKNRDFHTAYQAWHKAAEQNIAEAQWMLGIMLLNGQGVKQDNAAAYSWLTLASEKKHKQASIDRLAIRNRLTVEELAKADMLTAAFRDKQTSKTVIKQQKEQAFQWFEKAARKGDAHAQYQLGEMLLSGDGVRQDNVAAYSWFSLASQQNHPQAIVKQAQLKDELSASQIEKANALMLTNRDNHSINDAPPGLPEITEKSDIKVVQPTAEVMARSTVQTAPDKLTTLTTEKPEKTHKVKAEQKVSDDKPQAVTVYRVQVGAFKSREQVNIALAQLTNKAALRGQTYQTTITEPVEDTVKPDFYRLQLGNFAAKPEAKKLCQFLKQNKQPCFVVSSQSDK
ncbi:MULTISPECIES: SPOR domain-containing protein [unclassified Methylophaga]|jgi:cell division septation protein DedD|uniref:SPOR domain-containing protein n=1 Tax=unclassified Methylophaga TaxID=2629249 RepID=UPI00259CBFA1|nr:MULTISPECIES: SPOR domain-containing protein [unclassified Methylophaga]|tara:strand:+ start:2041 stop:3171 length:1131 start_codon:yes stop_codon:yes gene_type:complete